MPVIASLNHNTIDVPQFNLAHALNDAEKKACRVESSWEGAKDYLVLSVIYSDCIKNNLRYPKLLALIKYSFMPMHAESNLGMCIF